MNQGIIEKDIAEIVIRIFETPVLPHYPYHNLIHTRHVVAHVKEIAAHADCNETDTFILTMAAWFHDIGHLYGEWKDHEERSVSIMQHHLQNVFPDLTSPIGDCIIATKFPSHPVNLLGQIICDADTYHLGTDYFRQTDPMVEKEIELRTGNKNPNWHKKSLLFLQQHVFFTKYCRELLEEGKKQNIAWLLSQII